MRGIPRAQYPARPSERVLKGEAIGHRAGQRVGAWISSTDIGCAFLALDGLSQAYELLGWPELGELLEEMVEQFATLDLLALSCQTHSTLSALRGILRLYRITRDGITRNEIAGEGIAGEERLLALARTIYATYRREGMTENYANYNWFGRPDWTEPCAVIDSFRRRRGVVDADRGGGLSGRRAPTFLQRHGPRAATQRAALAATAAPARTTSSWHPRQRSSRLHGAARCAAARGLSRAIQYACMLDGDTVTFPFFHDATLTLRFADGEVTLRESAAYPVEGRVSFEVAQSTAPGVKKMRIYLPEWCDAEQARVTIDGRPVQAVHERGFMEFELAFRARPAH